MRKKLKYLFVLFIFMSCVQEEKETTATKTVTTTLLGASHCIITQTSGHTACVQFNVKSDTGEDLNQVCNTLGALDGIEKNSFHTGECNKDELLQLGSCNIILDDDGNSIYKYYYKSSYDESSAKKDCSLRNGYSWSSSNSISKQTKINYQYFDTGAIDIIE